MTNYRRIVLAARPVNGISSANFRVETVGVPDLNEGDVLVRNHFLSIDPYMRMRMEDTKSYAAPQALNECMIGGTAGVVVESRDPRFVPGDTVVGMLGWAEMGACSGALLRKVDTTHIPLSAYLGVVGMPGMTAWYGFHHILHAKAGQTLVVSAAAGAVGSVVGQLARLSGCRVVGIAGGSEKCRYVIDDLGFDACVDYKAGNLKADLRAATPDGIDMLFENVGGENFDACLSQMNAFGRIALCGMISGYNGARTPLYNVGAVLTMRLTIQGFIVTEHMQHWPKGLAELGRLVATGQLKYRESVADGLEAAPDALIGMLNGRNLGKQLVKLI